MTSLSGPSPALGSTAIAPLWAAYILAVQAPWLKLTPPCGSGGGSGGSSGASASGSSGKRRSRCLSAALSATLGVPLGGLPELARRRHGGSLLPAASYGGTLGGVKNFDVMDGDHVSAGPQVTWLTPDSPREDLLRLRVVSPGWAVRYTWEEAHVSVGVAAFTRFVMFGEDMPVVDMLTSEALVELELP